MRHRAHPTAAAPAVRWTNSRRCEDRHSGSFAPPRPRVVQELDLPSPGAIPKRNSPPSTPFAPTWDDRSSIACSTLRPYASARRPSSVKVGGFDDRSSSATPIAASRLCTRRVTAGWVRLSLAAARFTDPASATATNAFKSPRFMASLADYAALHKIFMPISMSCSPRTGVVPDDNDSFRGRPRRSISNCRGFLCSSKAKVTHSTRVGCAISI